jgi:ribosomal-protein-alanine N-acetyltransferase
MKELKEIPSRFVLRRMKKEDLPEVIQIEKMSFKSPWPEFHFFDELTTPHSHPYVVEGRFLDGRTKIVGYIFLWVFGEEIEIANIAVHPNYRRMRIGSSMLSVIEDIYRNKAKRVFLEVRVSNTPAIKLYKKMGFKVVGIRKRYYTDNDEDAIIMMKEIEGNN